MKYIYIIKYRENTVTMLGDIIKGYEIARFSGAYAEGSRKAKFFAAYPYLTLLFIPILPVMVWIHPGIPYDLKPFAILIGMAFVLPMEIFGFLVVDNVLKGRAAPIIIYSNGIENVGGRLGRWKKRTDFIPKSSIVHVEMYEFTVQQVRGFKTFVTVKIKTREGWKKFISGRPVEKMQGFRETVSSKLGIMVKYEQLGNSKKAPNKAPAYQVSSPPIDSGTNFCDRCGTKRVPGAPFCGRCGKKL
jgi:hypothetical protein